MTTSTPSNTSKSSCRCDQSCGCCSNKQPQEKKLGMIAKRPWLLVIAAFSLMFCAWGVMIYFAATNQPVRIPLVTDH